MIDAKKIEYPWHESSWDKILTARSQSHFPHALLIVGADGTGKTDFAENLVASLLCTSLIDNKACQTCRSCKTYQSEANPDFLKIALLEGKQQISVDQIRNLSEFISYTRSFNAYKVVLINPIERMNINAANSLLKSLEEPASNTVIILVATHLGRIIPTIKSRCQQLTLPSPDRTQAISWLQSQLLESNNSEELLDITNGKPLAALKITQDEIQSHSEFANELLSICLGQSSVTETAKKWDKYNHEKLLNWQITWLQTFIKNGASATSIQESESTSISKILTKLEKTLIPDRQWSLHQQLINQKQYIHTSVNSLLFIENMLLLWLTVSHSAR